MKFSSKNSERSKPAINLTSLLDVVFILLIFFAVNTSFMFAGEIDVDLPGAHNTLSDQEKDTITVTVARDNSITVDKVVVSETGLLDELKKARQSKPDAALVVEGDKGSMHGVVVTVIDAGRLAGFTKFAIATEEIR